MTRRGKCGELIAELAAFVEQFAWPIALHPIFELPEMFGILEIRDRHLMCAPGSFHRLAVDELRPGPAFWGTEHDHGPARSFHRFRSGPRHTLDLVNLRHYRIERPGQTLMYHGRYVAFHEMRLITVTTDQVGQFPAADAGEHGRIGYLESIEVKDWKNRAITRRVEKLVGVPARGERAGFRLAVADDTGDDQIRIVERRPIGMDQGIAQFAPLMDRSGSFRCDMAWDALRPGELPKEALQSVTAAVDVRIALRVGPFEIAVCHQPRTAMSGADDINHVEVVFFDQPVQVNINKVKSGGGAPMPEQTRLDVLEPERGFEQRVVLQINLSDGEIICGAPIRIHLFQQIGRQRRRHRGTPYGLVHAGGPVDFKAACSGGKASSMMFSADKIRVTISRGSGSIETAMGFSSRPGSSSSSN